MYRKDKYFVIQCISGQTVFNQHILHYTLEPVDNLLVKLYYSLEFEWPLSVYCYNGEIVTMNINTHTYEILWTKYKHAKASGLIYFWISGLYMYMNIELKLENAVV